MDIVGMIKRSKGAKFYTITRESGPGAYDQDNGGVFVPSATTTLQIWCSKQPLGFKDLETLPDGADRTIERHRFYSFPDLRTNQTSVMTEGDRVQINESTFRVESIAHWPNYSLAIIVKENTSVN